MVGLMAVRAIDRRAAEEDMTPLQRWKFRRNVVIVIAHENGASQRMLADVFDLPHSRIAAIVKEFKARYGGGHGEGKGSEKGA